MEAIWQRTLISRLILVMILTEETIPITEMVITEDAIITDVIAQIIIRTGQ